MQEVVRDQGHRVLLLSLIIKKVIINLWNLEMIK